MISNKDMAWCPGCGNFIIIQSIHEILYNKLNLSPKDYVLVSGIGQASKLPHHMQACNGFAGLHGRAIANATAMKIVNPKLKIIVFSGDGELLSEGGNHLIHAIRRNISITCFLHDNQVYALTKGQASSTMWQNAVTKIQYEGIKATPLNPLPMALVLGATFVARATVADQEHLKKIMNEALNHEGFSLVQILQTCPSFNKTRSFKWYKENTTLLDNNYDKTNYELALKSSSDLKNSIKLGIFYQKNKIPYEKSFSVLTENNLVHESLNHKFSTSNMLELM